MGPTRLGMEARTRLCFTVPEFCKAHRISRAHFYHLLRHGKGPRIMKAGKRTLVSFEAAEEWRRRMGEPAA